ncbi:MAG: beta-phosphoglucomutase [Salinivirgaceae bacterium]|jgi:beta-phosphoglucomutase|nr:beta-phosphoglucomutase [Salinivirgaceae bacterium]
MIKAILFDLDGVIVDTAKYHYIAWKALAEEMGFEFTLAHNERLKGVSRMTSLEILLEIGGVSKTDEEKKELAERKNEHYRTFITKMKPDEILPGMPEFLKGVKKAGLKAAIGSASKNTPTILKQIELDTFFDAVVDGNKIAKAKPDPEVFLTGASELNVKPEECMVLEDAASGIEAALNGGMYSVGVGSPDVLGKAHCVIAGFEGVSVESLIAKCMQKR